MYQVHFSEICTRTYVHTTAAVATATTRIDLLMVYIIKYEMVGGGEGSSCFSFSIPFIMTFALLSPSPY